MAHADGSLLIVDDDEYNCDILSRRLEQEGYTIAVAKSGNKAFEMMSVESFDLVLLDIMMPEIDGYDVLLRMKSDASMADTPVIMISALTERDGVTKCLQLGAKDYLAKPYNMNVVKSRIWRCLQTSHYLKKSVVSRIDLNGVEVLVVDDNELNRELLTRRMEKAGYRVHYASRAAEALNILRKKNVDLVLLDIMMPGMDGIEALKTIKSDEKLKDISVIMVSALDNTDSISLCLDLGADDYILKPFNAVLLNSVVTSCLGAKKAEQAELAQAQNLQQLSDEGKDIKGGGS